MHRKLRQHTSKDELHAGLLRGVRQLDASAGLLESIRSTPDPLLGTAILAVESSAWRGGGVRARAARILRNKISSYVASQENSVVIIRSQRVTLGGLSGTLPVSISNQLNYAITVRLHVTTSRAAGGLTSAAAGDVTGAGQHGQDHQAARPGLRRRLDDHHAEPGSPGGTALPGRTVTLTVQATHFGTLALVIIGAALGVFMLASVRRAFTRGRGEQPGPERPGRAPARPARNRPGRRKEPITS